MPEERFYMKGHGGNPKGNMDNLVMFEKGSERTRQIASMGGKASAKKHREKMDINLLVDLVGQYIMMPEKKGDFVTLEDVDSLQEMEKQNRRIIDKAMGEFCKRLASGDKRAITQLIELMTAGSDTKSKSDDNGLADAIRQAAEAWKSE